MAHGKRATAAAACAVALLALVSLGCAAEPQRSQAVPTAATEGTAPPQADTHEDDGSVRLGQATVLTQVDLDDYVAGEWYDAVTEAMAGYGEWEPSVPWYYSFSEDGDMAVEYRKGDDPAKTVSLSWDASTGLAAVTGPPQP